MIGLIQAKQHGLSTPYRLNAPLSCPTLAAHLIKAGLPTDAIDLDGLGQSENFILDGLQDYDAIGISALSSQAEGARRLIALIRAHAPGMYIVCGGVDPTLFPDKYLAWGANCVVTGEAEGNIAEVFTDRPKGIVAGVQGSLDIMPAWERTLPKPWQYQGHPHPLALPEAMMMVTRGCPHSCTFCGNTYKGQRTRLRSLDSIGEEFDYLAANGVKGIFLYDDELIDYHLFPHAANVTWLANQRFLFRAQGRCNWKVEDVNRLALLHSYGLRRVMWGVESFYSGVLHAIRKDLDAASIEDTLVASHTAGIENFVFLMAGMPEEDQFAAEVNYDTLELLLKEGTVQKVQITPCTPMPGTALYEQAKAEGWLWEGDPFQYGVTGGTPWMSQGQIVEHVNAMRDLARRYNAL